MTGAGRPGAQAAPAVPTLAQLQRAALDVIEDVGYGRELQADVRGFVDVRLRSLRTGSAGRFFEGGHPADIAELLRRNVVLAIEDVANDEDKAFLIGTLIIRLVEYLRMRARSDPADGLTHVIVIEEAHRLLRASKEGASAHAVELFASLLAEIRAYGEGIMVVEQIPAKLLPDVVKNTALKVLHRLPANDDREVVGAAMNLDGDQSRQVVSLRPGVAAVFADGMDRPLRIRVPFGGSRERVQQAHDRSVPVRGRRSAACGPVCVTGRACNLLELRAADLLTTAPEDAWLRIWAEASRAGVPDQPAAAGGAGRAARPVGRARPAAARVPAGHGRGQVAARPGASGPCLLRPAALSAVTAATALRLLDGGKGAGAPPGPDWVIPQVQWLHEVERVCPFGSEPAGPVRPGAAARLRAWTASPTGRACGSASGSPAAQAPAVDGACPQPAARLDRAARRGRAARLRRRPGRGGDRREPSRAAAPGSGRDGDRRLAGGRAELAPAVHRGERRPGGGRGAVFGRAANGAAAG